MVDEIYFVASDGDFPERIYFDREEAFTNNHNYIDSFNDKGLSVKSYKFEEEFGAYTEDF